MSRPVDLSAGAASHPPRNGVGSLVPGAPVAAAERPDRASPARAAAERVRRPGPGSTGGARRPVVLVGLMGAGKTTVGRRVAAILGVPFRDADAEIERAAGLPVSEIFSRYGEPEFRRGERGVIRRLLAGPPVVLATGGGAFVDGTTRAAIRRAGATTVWLRCSLPVLLRRTAGRTHRPLLNAGDPATILAELMSRRHPFYAEAEIVVDCGDETVEHTAMTVIGALDRHLPPVRVPVALERHRPSHHYEVMIGSDLLRRAGALLAPVLPRPQAVVVTDQTVAAWHLLPLLDGLRAAGIESRSVVIPPGEASKSLSGLGQLVDAILDPAPDPAPQSVPTSAVTPAPAPDATPKASAWSGLERRTAVIALGGGVVGDLAGFAAASLMRGLPFVQIPTTLLSQVDSSVGGKTGINLSAGKNLLGAFHQPLAVLADVDTLSTLPRRERAAGFAEIVKAGLIADPELFGWCEQHGTALVDGDPVLLAEAVARACRFKAAVVADDEREERPDGGRALLNLGHTFGHAIEAEFDYDGTVLHGEAVAIGLALAFELSAAMALCDPADPDCVAALLRASGLPARLDHLPRPPGADALLARMRGDKKRRDGRLAFVLARGIGHAFTTDAVDPDAVRRVLLASGASD